MNAPSDELTALLAAVLDDHLTPEQAARLDQLLNERPDALEAYIDLVQLHTALSWRYDLAADALATHESDADQATFAAREAGQGTSPERIASPMLSPLRLGLNYLSQPLHFGVFFASVALVSLLLFFAQVRLNPRDPASDSAFLARGERSGVVEEEAAAATLTATHESRWDGRRPSLAERLRPGERLLLRAGLAEITFPRGVRVIVEGPATFSIGQGGSIGLGEGKLTARVERPAGRGFTVQTPSASIVDLGTAFGVRVEEDETEIVVFSGKVVTLPRGGGSPEHLIADEALQLSSHSPPRRARVRDLPRRFVRRMPTSQSYAELIIRDQPLGWWRMEEPDPALLPAQDTAGTFLAGSYRGAVQSESSLPSLGQALRVGPQSGFLEIAHDDVFERLEALSVECWMRTDIAPPNYARLVEKNFLRGFVLAINPRATGRADLTPGHALWGVNNVFAQSAEPVTDGRWHHVVGVWDGAALRVYVDGISGPATDFVGPLGVSPDPLVIGAASRPTGGEQFEGCLDEVALYPRALSAEEITRHYEAGQPRPIAEAAQPPTPPTSDEPAAQEPRYRDTDE